MPDLPARTELFQVAAREVIARSDARAPGKRLAPKAIFTPGTDANVLLAGGSAMAEEVLRQHARDQGDLYLDSATLPGLERLLPDRYSRRLVRKRAAAALCPVRVYRAAGPLQAGTIAAGDKAKTSQGVEFQFMSAVSFAATQLGPQTVTMRAVLAGTGGNVAPDTITELINPFDQNLRINNDVQATGGANDEEAGSYRERGRSFFLAAPGGTLRAIEFGSRSVPGIALATVEEQLDQFGDPTGYVFIYLADANGMANAAVVQLVKDALREYRCCGIPPIVVGAIPEYVDVVYRTRFTVGTDQQLAFDQLRFATVALVAQIPPNKPLERSLLMALGRQVPGMVVLDDFVVTPLGDLYPSASGRVIRTTLDRVTQVAP